MSACVCPCCKARFTVKDIQSETAQGFIVCARCSCLFQPDPPVDNVSQRSEAENTRTEAVTETVTDIKLASGEGFSAYSYPALLKHEISTLLDNAKIQEMLKLEAAKPQKEPFNWTLASLTALTVLIMQLFYLLIIFG